MKKSPMEFPINYLPALIRNVVTGVHQDTQISKDIIASVALTTISLACQTKYQVELYGLMKPIGVFTIISADSGERKTVSIDKVSYPLFEFDKAESIRNKLTIEKSVIDQLVNGAIVKAYEKKINKKIASGQHYLKEQNEYKEYLLSIRNDITKKHKLIYENATIEAIQMGLHNNYPSGGLLTDEGGIVLKGRAKIDPTFFNKLWDGRCFDVERKSSESFHVDSPRFTLLLMVQPEILMDYFKTEGRRGMGSGFLPRCLILNPEPMQGKRLDNVESNFGDAPLKLFHERINYYLNELIETPDAEPKILTLSPDAKLLLNEKQQVLEKDMLKFRDKFAGYCAFASKAPENIVRIASLLHLFGDTPCFIISRDEIENATKIMKCYLEATYSLFTTTYGTPENDAEHLYKWLYDLRDTQTGNFITGILQSKIRRYVTDHLRDTDRINKALQILKDDEKIEIIAYKNFNGTTSNMVKVIR